MACDIQERFLRHASGVGARRQATTVAPPPPVGLNTDGVPFPNTNLTPYEQARAAAYSVAMAVDASRLAEVRAFRELFLGHALPDDWSMRPWDDFPPDIQTWLSEWDIWQEDMRARRCSENHVLTTQEALVFLGSVALAYFQEFRLACQGVPFLAHRARLATRAAQCDESPERWVLLRWGRDRRIRYAIPSDNSSYIAWSTAIEEDARGYSIRRVTCVAHSVHDRLRTLAEQLEQRYGWPAPQAAWWVLTGQRIPFLTPVRMVHKFSGLRETITITIDPWITPERLEDVYRPIYRWMHLHSPRPTPRHPRTYDVVAFALAHADADGRMPTWASMQREWNNLHSPGLHIKSGPNMATIYRRGIASMHGR